MEESKWKEQEKSRALFLPHSWCFQHLSCRQVVFRQQHRQVQRCTLTTQSTDGRMFMFTHTAQRKMPNGRESLWQKRTAVFIRQALRLLLNRKKSSSTTVLKKAMARSSILRQQVFHLKPANVKCSQPKSSGLITASLMITLTVTHLQQTIRLFQQNHLM